MGFRNGHTMGFKHGYRTRRGWLDGYKSGPEGFRV